jgi:hypothetical protein
MPAISSLLFPSNILRVLPQQLYLICGVASVPQRISHELARSSFAVDKFDLNSRLSVCDEGLLVPVLLSVSFPSDSVEALVALVTENESYVVVVNLCVHKQGSLEINVGERIVSDRHSWIAVENLHHLSAFVVDDPAGVLLVVTDRIESDPLEGSEVGCDDFVVVRTNVDVVVGAIAIKIFFTGVSDSVVVVVTLIAVLKEYK